jgi:hypothetical protein
MSGLSGSVEPAGVDIVTEVKKTLSNKIFAHLRPSSYFFTTNGEKKLNEDKA